MGAYTAGEALGSNLVTIITTGTLRMGKMTTYGSSRKNLALKLKKVEELFQNGQE